MMTSSRSAPWLLCGLGGRSLSLLLPVRGRRPRPAHRESSAPPLSPPAPPPPPPPPPLRRLPTLGRFRVLFALSLAGLRLDHLDLRLSDGDALGVNRVGLLLRDDH